MGRKVYGPRSTGRQAPAPLRSRARGVPQHGQI